MPLTDSVCRNTKPSEKARKLFDGGGLYLLVRPNGSRLWQLAYRASGKSQTLSFGPDPVVSLAQARAKRDGAKRILADGGDPRSLGQAAPGGRTFRELAEEWLDAKSPAWKAGHRERVASRLRRNVYPRLGAKPVLEIEAPEILEAVREVEAREALDVAKRTKQTVSSVCRFAIAKGEARRDPAADLRGALKAGGRMAAEAPQVHRLRPPAGPHNPDAHDVRHVPPPSHRVINES